MRCCLALLMLAPCFHPAGAADVLTSRYNAGRTGVNPQSTALDPILGNDLIGGDTTQIDRSEQVLR